MLMAGINLLCCKVDDCWFGFSFGVIDKLTEVVPVILLQILIQVIEVVVVIIEALTIRQVPLETFH